jgi:glutamate racemase
MDNRPIGVFDSGLGGLTVLKEIMELLPSEDFVYFGDCGRVPYGTKSEETVIKYSLQDTRFLMSHDVKMIVIACGTASAYGYEAVKDKFQIPVIEVVSPCAKAAVMGTVNGKVGIIATTGAVDSGVYNRAISGIDSSIEIFSKACPMFVQLAEEGWWENDIALRIAEEYLIPLRDKAIDTLVLGCTHYPLLQKIISKVMGPEVKLVSSGAEVAMLVKETLESTGALKENRICPINKYFTSDSIVKFKQLGSSFLGRSIQNAEKVDIEKF